jgi:hypothetical protein
VGDIATPTPADLSALSGREPGPTEAPDRMVDATMDGGSMNLSGEPTGAASVHRSVTRAERTAWGVSR